MEKNRVKVKKKIEGSIPLGTCASNDWQRKAGLLQLPSKPGESRCRRSCPVVESFRGLGRKKPWTSVLAAFRAWGKKFNNKCEFCSWPLLLSFLLLTFSTAWVRCLWDFRDKQGDPPYWVGLLLSEDWVWVWVGVRTGFGLEWGVWWV